MQLVRALVESGPAQGASVQAQTAVTNTGAMILPANPKRKGLIVQNTGLTIVRLVMGTTTPTQTVYHVALKACTGADDGSGGAYFDDSWVGQVWAISSVPGGTIVVTEFTANSPDWDQSADWGLPARVI